MATETSNAQNLVEIKEIKGNVVFLKNGGLRQVIMVNGINFALKSDDEQNVILHSYQNFLNSLDFQLQIIVRSRKVSIGKYIEKLEEYRRKEISPLLQNQNDEYREFIKKFVEKNAIMEKVFLVVVPYAPTMISAKTSMNSLPFFKKTKEVEAQAQKEEIANYEESVQQLKQRSDQVIEGLSAIGLDTVLLEEEALIELFYNFYNPESAEKEVIPH